MFGTYVNGAAGYYSNIQIINPSGSGVMAFIDGISGCSADVVSSIRLITYNTSLTTLVGAGINKYSGEADGACQVRSEYTSSLLSGDELYTTRLTDLSIHDILLTDPIILSQGMGVVFETYNVNVSLIFNVQWREL